MLISNVSFINGFLLFTKMTLFLFIVILSELCDLSGKFIFHSYLKLSIGFALADLIHW